MRETVPAKAPRLLRVMMDVLEEPIWTANEVGLTEILKSTRSTVTVANRNSEPLVPLTVTT